MCPHVMQTTSAQKAESEHKVSSPRMALPWMAASAVMLVSWLVSRHVGTTRFVPDACNSVERLLSDSIVGQDLAISQLINVVCSHISKHEQQPANQLFPSSSATPLTHQRTKPLIISVHGPPGVGKTYSHMLLARALYSRHPHTAVRCPGMDCEGAKVVYGLDFPAAVRGQQLEAVRAELLAHCNNVKDPMVVIEEYDKLDCSARTMLRQLLEHAYEGDGLSGGLSR